MHDRFLLNKVKVYRMVFITLTAEEFDNYLSVHDSDHKGISKLDLALSESVIICLPIQILFFVMVHFFP